MNIACSVLFMKLLNKLHLNNSNYNIITKENYVARSQSYKGVYLRNKEVLINTNIIGITSPVSFRLTKSNCSNVPSERRWSTLYSL